MENVWKWVTGEEWTYSNWNDNEPNNSGNEDGLHFYSNGKWNDIPTTKYIMLTFLKNQFLLNFRSFESRF